MANSIPVLHMQPSYSAPKSATVSLRSARVKWLARVLEPLPTSSACTVCSVSASSGLFSATGNSTVCKFSASKAEGSCGIEVANSGQPSLAAVSWPPAEYLGCLMTTPEEDLRRSVLLVESCSTPTVAEVLCTDSPDPLPLSLQEGVRSVAADCRTKRLGLGGGASASSSVSGGAPHCCCCRRSKSAFGSRWGDAGEVAAVRAARLRQELLRLVGGRLRPAGVTGAGVDAESESKTENAPSPRHESEYHRLRGVWILAPETAVTGLPLPT